MDTIKKTTAGYAVKPLTKDEIKYWKTQGYKSWFVTIEFDDIDKEPEYYNLVGSDMPMIATTIHEYLQREHSKRYNGCVVVIPLMPYSLKTKSTQYYLNL